MCNFCHWNAKTIRYGRYKHNSSWAEKKRGICVARDLGRALWRAHISNWHEHQSALHAEAVFLDGFLLDIRLGESGQDLGQVLQPLVDENLFPAKNKAINKRYLLIWIRIPTLPWIKKSAKHCYNTGKTCFLLQVL